MIPYDIGSFRQSIHCWYVSNSDDLTRFEKRLGRRRSRFVLLTEGERRFQVAGKDYLAVAGDLVCMGDSSNPYGHVENHLGWKGYQLQYHIANRNRAPFWVNFPPVLQQVSPEIRGYVRAINLECLDTDILANRRARAFLELLLTSLAGLVQTDSLIRLLEQALRRDLAENLQLEDAAKRCNASPATLKRHLKQRRGESFSQFKHGIKIAVARQILTFEPDRTLADLAEQLGYHDAFHFSKTFKRYTGLSPRKFRRQAE